jgi:hypothetical protein
MTLEEFKALKSLEDRRVRMTFADGQEIVARLISVTVVMDDSRHVIYDKVEWSTVPHTEVGAGGYYTPGEELISCALASESVKDISRA